MQVLRQFEVVVEPFRNMESTGTLFCLARTLWGRRCAVRTAHRLPLDLPERRGHVV